MSPGPFDFPSAERPNARALQDSFAHDEIEAELRALFLELFERLSADAFDADVMGAPHLGSFALVQRMVNHDGLVLLRGEREQAATRYLYRAWKSGDIQKRGLHFLRTYLQLLLPNQVQVRQLWHDSRFPYGEAFRANEPREQLFRFLSEPSLRLDGSWRIGRTVVPLGERPPIHVPDSSVLFLTSRIDIVLSLEAMADSAYLLPGQRRSVLGALLEVIRAVVPARLTPAFRFWLAFVLDARTWVDYRLRMSKSVDLRFPWCGRVITEADEAQWSLGRNPWPVRLPQPFGTFRVGERRGDPWTWRLRGCRIEAPLLARLTSAAEVYRTATLEPWRRLNGSWALSQRRSTALTAAHLTQRAAVDAAAAISTTHHDWIRLHYPRTPTRLGRMLRVDGRWCLDTGEVLRSEYCALSGQFIDDACQAFWAAGSPKLRGDWRLGRSASIESAATLRLRLSAPISVRPEALLPDSASGRPARPMRLDGRALGRSSAPIFSTRTLQHYALESPLDMTSRRTRQQAIVVSLPSAARRLGVGRRLDGRWRVEPGERLSMALRGPALSGWALGRDRPVDAVARAQLHTAAAVTVGVERLMRADDRVRRLRLTGWPLGRMPAAPGVLHQRRDRVVITLLPSSDGRCAQRSRVTFMPYGPERRLGLQRALDGRWSLCAGERLALTVHAPRLTGWPLNRSMPVTAERASALSMRSAATATPARLARQYSTRLQSWPRRLDGHWSLGAIAHVGRFRLDGSVALKNRKIAQFHRLGTFTLRPDHDAARHWPVYDERAQARCVPRLNGAWGLGGPAGALEASIRIIKRNSRTAAHG